MDKNKPIILCAGGNSIPFLNSRYNHNGFKHGLEPQLEEIIKGNYSIGLNYFFKYGCNTTFDMFNDFQFYLDNTKALKHLPLIVGSFDPSLKNQNIDRTHDNTILLKVDNKAYYGKDAWDRTFYCYDKETEVLTDQGWKYFKDLDKTEKIATLNKNTHKVEYNFPINYIKQKYSGDMIEEKSKRIDLVVTPNHNMYVKTNANKNMANYKFIQAKDLNNKIIQYLKYFPYENKKDKNFFYLPKIKKTNDKYKIKMNYWLEFLGWYLSEGCCVILKNMNGNYRIIISQKIKNNVTEIRKCLKACGFHYHEDVTKNKTINFVISNKRLYTYLYDCRNSSLKYIKREFLNLSKNQLNILFKTLIKGDGCISKEGRYSYATISNLLANDIFELGMKLGYSPSIGLLKSGYKPGNLCYSINFSKTRSTTITDKKRRTIKYDDYVYCVEVPNNIIYVKRNGKSCWSGNSKQLVGIFAINLAICLGFTEIYLLGYDCCAINGQTHFYESIADLTKSTPIYIRGVLKDTRMHYRGVGKYENGSYKTSTYNNERNHLNETWFAPFKNLKNINIYNVSPESAITVFPKISYDDFYAQVPNNHIMQEQARANIKRIILDNKKG